MKKNIHVYAVTVILSLIITGFSVSCGGGGKESQSKESETQAQKTVSSQAKTTRAEFTPDLDKGKQLFLQVCAACHGPDAKGLPNLGRDLTNSKFIAEKNDQELLEFVKVGRSPTDPLNTTGIPMPPKGGNPALTDEDILHIIAYIRTLQAQPNQ